MSHCHFTNNFALTKSGVMALFNVLEVTLNSCFFKGNAVIAEGAGIVWMQSDSLAREATLSINGGVFTQNGEVDSDQLKTM